MMFSYEHHKVSPFPKALCSLGWKQFMKEMSTISSCLIP